MSLLSSKSTDARHVLDSLKKGAVQIAVLSLVLGFGPIAFALFLLLEFDVGIPGHSTATVLGLLIVILLVLGVQGILSAIRDSMLNQVGDLVVLGFQPRITDAFAQIGERSGSDEGQLQTLDNLDAMAGFAKSGALASWIDMLVLPLQLLFLLIVGGWFALTLLLATAVLGLILHRTLLLAARLDGSLERGRAQRHAVSAPVAQMNDLVRALGMRESFAARWKWAGTRLLRAGSELHHGVAISRNLADHALLAAVALQIGFGAWLATDDRASTASVIAAAVITWLALTPAVRAIASVPEAVRARRAWAQVDGILHAVPPPAQHLPIPAPSQSLVCEGMAVTWPGGRQPLVYNVQAALKAGEVLAVLGPVGSGKSSVLRGIAGAWPLLAGKVRLDGAALDQWDDDMLGRHVGYVPQQAQLFDATVSQNIARFRADATPEQIVLAAQRAGVHEAILRLPEGYNTPVGHLGRKLSSGQIQKIALARAMFDDPFLLVLDEPTAHLDAHEVNAVGKVLLEARDRGRIVVVAGVAPLLVEIATHVLMLRQRVPLIFGPKEQVRQKLMNDPTAARHDAPALGQEGGAPQETLT